MTKRQQNKLDRILRDLQDVEIRGELEKTYIIRKRVVGFQQVNNIIPSDKIEDFDNGYFIGDKIGFKK